MSYLSVVVAFAEQGDRETVEKTLNITLLKDEFSISSVFGYKDLYFNISPVWKLLPGSFLNLFVSYSSGLNPKLSSLTLYLNGFPIYSMPLSESGIWKSSIKIPIPESNLKHGVNVIEIKSLIKTSEGNPVGWLRIHKESYCHIKYSLKEDLGLKEFPSPYFEENVPIDDATLFVLPDKWSLEELKSVIMITLDWVRRSPSKTFIPKMVTMSELTSDIKERSHLIYLGREKAFSPEVIEEFKIDKSKLKGKVFISGFVNPHGKGRLLVTAEDSEGVIKGVVAILSKEIKKQMEGKEVYLPLTIDFKLNKEEHRAVGKIIYLSELIGSDLIFNGIYSHSDAIGLKIPPNWNIKGDASLNLKLRYSSNLDEKMSGLTILINGVPIKSVNFSPKGLEEEKITLSIPKSVLKQGYLYITFNAYLDIGLKESNYSYPEIAWLVIDKESYFNIPHDVINLEPLLENFPYSVSKGKIGVFLGKEISSAALNTLLCCLIGLQKNVLKPFETYLFNLSEFSEEKIVENGLESVIVLSSLKEAEEMGIKPELDKITVLPNFLEKTTIWQANSLRIGSSEVYFLNILWLNKHPVVLDSSYDEALVQWILKGNISLLSDKGEVIPFYVKSSQEANPHLKLNEPTFWELILSNIKYSRTLIGVFVLSVVSVIVVIFITLVRHKRNL